MGFCKKCGGLMTWDGSSGKLICKNDNCGRQKPSNASNIGENVQNGAKGNERIDNDHPGLDEFLETIVQNYQKVIIYQNKRFKLGKRPIYNDDTVNFYNEQTRLYLTATRWNLPKEKYIDLPGSVLTGMEKYRKKALTFFLAETPHDRSNYVRFDKQFCLQKGH
jgi:DNA-directed RNA polymerase subunit M/transcription elongation factor TFIIS